MVDENNLAQLEHMDNTFWQYFIDIMLKDQKSFLSLNEQANEVKELLIKNGFQDSAALIALAMIKLSTEAVRRGLIPAQSTEGFGEWKNFIEENS